MKGRRIAGLGVLVAAIAASAVLAVPAGAAKTQISVVCGSGAAGTTIATVSYPSGTAEIVYSFVIGGVTFQSGQQLPRPKANAGTAFFVAGDDPVESLTAEGLSSSGKSLGTVTCIY